MATVSLRLSDEVLSEVDCLAVSLGMGRAEYFQQALVRISREKEGSPSQEPSPEC